ncbi:sigma factor-like helix-turn-helix DNA-binding protein [Streptomyces shenzhenensis]|uniref:sigma factor-like helix-turn-helix DNA-binding protein n=1 Tax=Streptomyces shenzhenensis TaxID=943815 RepID=UPI003D8BF3A0
MADRKPSKPKPRKPGNPLGAGTLNAAELDAQAEEVYTLHKGGHSLVAIARSLGLTKDAVERRIARARRNLPQETSDDLRADRESSLIDLIRESHENLANAETVAERNACIRTIADLNVKLSKLLGLEVPAKVVLEMEQVFSSQRDGIWEGEVQ